MRAVGKPRIQSWAESSFRFHQSVESPGAFIQREWKPIALAGAAFVSLMLIALFVPAASFFYPRIETDQLAYLLKAKALAETGTTAARIAVNATPFAYAAMPGILRAPLLLVFNDFDSQLRGIQLFNVLIVGLNALMAAYILSWVLPERVHKWAIGYSFAFPLLSPDWLTNTFVPLADAPYAALTAGCIITAGVVLSSDEPLGKHRRTAGLFAGLFSIAFFVRFTAPVLLVPVALLAWRRSDVSRISRRSLVLMLGVPALILGLFIRLGSDAIFGRYLMEPVSLALHASKPGMALNLFASAIPAQIIPVFNLGYQVNPLSQGILDPVFGHTHWDFFWVIVGLSLSAVVVHGMILAANRMLPEIACFLAALPVLTVLIPSTTRYLMSYQPIIWVCLVTGLASIARPLRSRASALQIRALIGAVAMIAATGIVFMRFARTAQTATGSSGRGPVASELAYLRDVEDTFAGLRFFLEELPRGNTLLIGGHGDVGRFKVIANRDYYIPDSGLKRVVTSQNVYKVLSCSTSAACIHFDSWIITEARSVEQFGEFTYETVYEQRTPNARAIVQRLRLRAQDVPQVSNQLPVAQPDTRRPP